MAWANSMIVWTKRMYQSQINLGSCPDTSSTAGSFSVAFDSLLRPNLALMNVAVEVMF